MEHHESYAGAVPGTVVVRDRVQWSDVDAAGIVCFGAYLRFFERAESELFRSIGLPLRTLAESDGIWLVRRRIECDFLQPALLDEELEVSVAAGSVGRTSVELSFQVFRPGERAPKAVARYVLVAVDRESLRPVPLPAGLASAIRGHSQIASEPLEPS